MNARLFSRDDPALIAFHEREAERAAQSTEKRPYIPFGGVEPPMEEGKIDPAFLRAFGVEVPEGHYLVLGDNYPMSQDSRAFGFVPEANLQGAPSWILWPPGNRWGRPFQEPYPTFVLPRLIIWTLAALAAVIYYCYREKKRKQLLELLS